MKKLFFILGLCSIFAACSSNNSENTSSSHAGEAIESNQNLDSTGTNKEISTYSVSSTTNNTTKGQQLISQADCLTCHKEQEKLIGPAYVDVAKKYEPNDKNLNYLVQKIIGGGSGVWGQIPMTPHPAIAKEDAKEMVKYILSLNH